MNIVDPSGWLGRMRVIMQRVQLIHWNSAETGERVRRLKNIGYEVAHDMPLVPDLFRTLREQPPAAVIIDLDRAPSQGRDIGLAIRHHAATRHLPLVFTGGAEEKIAAVRRILPDARYTPWSKIQSALKQAITNPPVNPVVPRSVLEGYSGTPLPKKLGIKKTARTQHD